MAFHTIAQIDSSQSSWNVKAKVIRLWLVSDFNRNTAPFSLEMVLLDAQGKLIHASVKKTLIYKFKNDLTEGNIYSFEDLGIASNGGNYRTTTHAFKLNFQFSTKVFRVPNETINLSPYKFVEISDIVEGKHNPDFLVDVAGVLTGVGTESEVQKNGKTHKLNVIVLEALGSKIQCTLFGNYVDELNNFMATGETDNALVFIQLAKVKYFQEKYHLQNCISCTKVVFNSTCPIGTLMRKRLIDEAENPSPMTLTQLQPEPKLNIEEEFIYKTERITIQALKEVNTESIFVLIGKVTQIQNPENWWYTACSCGKSVYQDSNMYFCEKCDKHIVNVHPRYRIKIRVMDNHESASLVIFDKEAYLLFNKTCAEMMRQKPAEGSVLPPDLAALVDSEMLFKVVTKPNFNHNPKFEESFKVSKICTSEPIIKAFKEKWEHEEALFLKNTNESLSLSVMTNTKGLDKFGCSGGNLISLLQDLDTISGNVEGKGKDKIIDADCSAVSQDLLPKFSEAESDIDVIPKCNENLAKPKSSINVPNAAKNPEESSSSKRASPTEEPVAFPDDVPLKTVVRRRIKIEKI